MKKFKYAIITIILSILNIQPISAACTQEEINNFKRIEDDYTVKYEIDKSTKMYNLYFSATKPKQYYYKIYASNKFKCTIIDDETNKCGLFPLGTYEISIVGVTDNCKDVLKTIKINLPKYNELSEDPLCKGIEEFVLCNPEYSKDIEYDEFVSRVETYKKNKVTKEDSENTSEEEEKQENVVLNKLTGLFEKYVFEIIIIVAFIVLVIITVIVNIKTVRKSRYLE